jgi:hypothetical protein
MKRTLGIATVVMMMVNVSGQGYDFNKSHYGLNFYQSATGSGYGSSMNLNLNVQKYNRIFEIGVMLNPVNQQVKGIEFLYKHFTGFHSARFYKRAVKPYFYYNFLYRMPTEVIVNSLVANSASFNYPEFGGKVTTFEHAIGFGLQTRLVKQFYCETNIGFGVYFGSHYSGITPHSWGIHLNNYGYVPSFKLGFGYQF